MKYISICICCCLFLMISCTSSTKKTTETTDVMDTATVVFPEDTQGISEAVTRFTRAYISQDGEKANALIHPDLGLYVIYRPGVADAYERVDSLDFSKPLPEYFPYASFEHDYALLFDKLPVFDCGELKWDKLGFFCDTTSQANQLTTIATLGHEFNDISGEELTQIKQLEKNTFRVILTQDENLIFHVKKYQDRWYIIVLDRAYGGCDA